MVMWTGSICYAGDEDAPTTDEKIDSIYSLQKKMYKTIRNEPLANKKAGVEVNIFQLLFLDESLVLSGGFFAIDNDSKMIFDMELLKFGWAF